MEASREDRRQAGLIKIARTAYIGQFTTIGYKDNPSVNDYRGDDLVYIGDDCSIGNCCSISEGVTIGNRVKIGNNVVIRSGVWLSDDCVIGHGTVFEGMAFVGEDTLIHAQCHITRGAQIGSKVFIAPLFVGANDPLCMRRKFIDGQPEFVPVPYCIGDGVRIGIGVVLLPGVVVGDNAQIAAGSIVTKDVAPGTLVMGVPAKFSRNVREKVHLKEKASRRRING